MPLSDSTDEDTETAEISRKFDESSENAANSKIDRISSKEKSPKHDGRVIFILEEHATGYEKLASILGSLNRTNLLEVFKKEGIDDELLLNVNVADKMDWDPISNTIPQIGLRIKFRHAVLELQVGIIIINSQV